MGRGGNVAPIPYPNSQKESSCSDTNDISLGSSPTPVEALHSKHMIGSLAPLLQPIPVPCIRDEVHSSCLEWSRGATIFVRFGGPSEDIFTDPARQTAGGRRPLSDLLFPHSVTHEKMSTARSVVDDTPANTKSEIDFRISAESTSQYEFDTSDGHEIQDSKRASAGSLLVSDGNQGVLGHEPIEWGTEPTVIRRNADKRSPNERVNTEMQWHPLDDSSGVKHVECAGSSTTQLRNTFKPAEGDATEASEMKKGSRTSVISQNMHDEAVGDGQEKTTREESIRSVNGVVDYRSNLVRTLTSAHEPQKTLHVILESKIGEGIQIELRDSWAYVMNWLEKGDVVEFFGVKETTPTLNQITQVPSYVATSDLDVRVCVFRPDFPLIPIRITSETLLREDRTKEHGYSFLPSFLHLNTLTHGGFPKPNLPLDPMLLSSNSKTTALSNTLTMLTYISPPVQQTSFIAVVLNVDSGPTHSLHQVVEGSWTMSLRLADPSVHCSFRALTDETSPRYILTFIGTYMTQYPPIFTTGDMIRCRRVKVENNSGKKFFNCFAWRNISSVVTWSSKEIDAPSKENAYALDIRMNGSNENISFDATTEARISAMKKWISKYMRNHLIFCLRYWQPLKNIVNSEQNIYGDVVVKVTSVLSEALWELDQPPDIEKHCFEHSEYRKAHFRIAVTDHTAPPHVLVGLSENMMLHLRKGKVISDQCRVGLVPGDWIRIRNVAKSACRLVNKQTGECISCIRHDGSKLPLSVTRLPDWCKDVKKVLSLRSTTPNLPASLEQVNIQPCSTQTVPPGRHFYSSSPPQVGRQALNEKWRNLSENEDIAAPVKIQRLNMAPNINRRGNFAAQTQKTLQINKYITAIRTLSKLTTQGTVRVRPDSRRQYRLSCISELLANPQTQTEHRLTQVCLVWPSRARDRQSVEARCSECHEILHNSKITSVEGLGGDELEEGEVTAPDSETVFPAGLSDGSPCAHKITFRFKIPLVAEDRCGKQLLVWLEDDQPFLFESLEARSVYDMERMIAECPEHYKAVLHCRSAALTACPFPDKTVTASCKFTNDIVVKVSDVKKVPAIYTLAPNCHVVDNGESPEH